MTVARFQEGRVFRPQDIQAMSTALEDVCKILDLSDEAKSERELLAQNILALAHQGERNAALLRDRMLREIAYGQEWVAGGARSRGSLRGALRLNRCSRVGFSDDPRGDDRPGWDEVSSWAHDPACTLSPSSSACS